MEQFSNLPAAQKAVINFYTTLGSQLPSEVQPLFIAIAFSGGPVDQAVKTGELFYARRSQVSTEAKQLAVSLIAYCTMNGFYGLAAGRGDQIIQALQRDLGETPPTGMQWPDASADPAPLPEYAIPAPAAQIPAPAAPEQIPASDTASSS